MIVLGTVSILLGGVNAIWLIGMIDQWLIPWSSLSVLRLD